MGLSVYCADVGSVATGKFAWYGVSADGRRQSGRSMEGYAAAIGSELDRGEKVAMGLECPLFIPTRGSPELLLTKRSNEGSRPWSAGAAAQP